MFRIKNKIGCKKKVKTRKRINAYSAKRTQEKEIYYELVVKLIDSSDNKSELSGEKADWRGLHCHHIHGRTGTRYTDPFNVIVLSAREHDEIHEHNTYDQKQELLRLVKPIRISQGFTKYGGK